MLDEKLVLELERKPNGPRLSPKKGSIYNKCVLDFRLTLIQAVLVYMRNDEGRAPSTLDQVAETAGYSKWAIFKYPVHMRPRLEELLVEALKSDHAAAEIGALIAKRKGITFPCEEPMPWEEPSKVWLWWRTVLIALARPT